MKHGVLLPLHHGMTSGMFAVFTTLLGNSLNCIEFESHHQDYNHVTVKLGLVLLLALGKYKIGEIADFDN